jgi:hypothetical protein
MPTSRRRPRNQPVASSQGKPQWGLLVVGILAGAIGMRAWDAKQALPPPGPAPSPIVDGDKKQDGKKQEKETPIENVRGFVIFVHERHPMSSSDLSLLDAVEELCKQHEGIQYRSVDVADPSENVTKMKQIASSKNINPPFVIFKSEDGQKINVAPMPKSLDEVKRVMK